VLVGDVDVGIALGPEAGRAIFGQLIANAKEHGASKVTISATRQGTTLRVVVADDGQGISPGIVSGCSRRSSRRGARWADWNGTPDRARDAGAHGGSIRLLESETGAAFEIVVRSQSDSLEAFQIRTI
jgi:LytS/YehU family sensor histidine kinase